MVASRSSRPARSRSTEASSLTGDEATGANIVRVAIEAPLKQIALNAGLEPGVVANKVRDLPAGHGLNAATGEYGDLLAQGIIDPAKVTRSALQNAASIAGLFLTTEAVVADKPEKVAGSGRRPDGWHGLLVRPQPTAASREGPLLREARRRLGGRPCDAPAVSGTGCVVACSASAYWRPAAASAG